jgi:WD40 repeat protein
MKFFRTLLGAGHIPRKLTLRCTRTAVITDLQKSGRYGSLREIRFSADSRFLTAADGTIKVWDAETGKRKEVLGSKECRCTAFSPNGETVLVGHADGSISVWDARTFVRKSVISSAHNGCLDTLAFSPDGVLFASANCWGPVTRDTMGTLIWGPPDHRVLVWNSNSGKLVHELNGHEGGVRKVAFSPNGSLLASGGRDGSLIIWDVRSGGMKKRIWDGSQGLPRLSPREPSGNRGAGYEGVHSVTFGGDLLMMAGQAVTLVDVHGAGMPRQIDVPFSHGFYGADMPADGSLLLTGTSSGPMGPGTLAIRGLATEGRTWSTVDVFSIHHVAFAPNGKLFAAANFERTLWLWRVES